MKYAAVLATAAVLAGIKPAARITDHDFQQLMEAAVLASRNRSDVQPTTKIICVRRELDTPPEYSRFGRLINSPAVAKAITAAIVPKAAAGQASIRTLPSGFILFSSAAPAPPECAIIHAPSPRGWPSFDSAVQLSFTRPAIAKGYAFIQEYEDCPGLCGTTFLRVFRKHDGKWIQVERAVLSVS